MIGGVLCMLGLIIAYSSLTMIYSMMGPNTKRIRRAGGRAILQMQRVTAYGMRSNLWYLRFGLRRFRLNEQQAAGFWHGGRYTLYYLRHSPTHILLSAEPQPE